ncbi:MAG: hypothetical protein IID16_03930 [Candidatus Marinimicrobia bacterium]|nr:hypothetical protein [Candidatus Neomarinimicrobiota bacterium]
MIYSLFYYIACLPPACRQTGQAGNFSIGVPTEQYYFIPHNGTKDAKNNKLLTILFRQLTDPADKNILTNIFAISFSVIKILFAFLASLPAAGRFARDIF